MPAGQTIAYASAIMGCFYVLAFAIIPFLPETRGLDLDRARMSLDLAGHCVAYPAHRRARLATVQQPEFSQRI